MGDQPQNQSQTRAHKKNVGALQALSKQVEELQKDKKKVFQNIDHELMDAHRFLEQILSSTGNSVTFEEAFPNAKRNALMSGIELPVETNTRQSKSSILRMEVKLRKNLEEARFKVRSEEFFRRWKESFNQDLKLDDWFLKGMSDCSENEFKLNES